MADYNINKSDGTSVTIPENSKINNFSIPLIGENYSNYGDEIAKAFLHMLENFAANGAPNNPTAGQLWYDKDDHKLKLRNAANTQWNDVLLTNDSGTVEHCGDIDPCQDDTYDMGSSSLKWNEIYATAFRGTADKAKYADSGGADVAEYYIADDDYPLGTVLSIGGSKEVTAATDQFIPIGVVSATDQAAVTMNNAIADSGTLVALMGRVLVYVVGPIKRGRPIYPGALPGTAIEVPGSHSRMGIALEDNDNEGVKLVECLIGK